MVFRFIVLLVGACAVSANAASLFDFRAEASSTWAENLSRSSAPADQRDAAVHAAEFSASLSRQLSPSLFGTAQLELGATKVPRYELLDEIRVGPALELRHKFGLGPLAPVLSGSASLQHRSSRLRVAEGWSAEAAVRVSKRLNETLRVAGTGDWHEHYGRHSTFDVRYQRLLGEINWDITDRWQVSGGYGALWGDFTANASRGVWTRALAGELTPAIFAYYPTVPWLETDIYGPRWVTYRVTGRSRSGWLEISPALTDRTALAFRYERVLTDNKAGVSYRQESWTASLVHQF